MHGISKIFQAEYITVLCGSALITPFCGALFACGCTWPGLGLEANCNFFDPQALSHCPWCASFFVGGISVTAAIFSGYLIAKKSIRFIDHRVKTDAGKFVTQLLAGITGFLLVAFACAWISASLQDYPLFIVRQPNQFGLTRLSRLYHCLNSIDN